jgi:DNA-binding response OmpR family regulator
MSTDSAKNRIKLVIVGLSQSRRELLCFALEKSAPGRFEFIPIDNKSLADINDSELVSDAVILAGTENLPADESLSQAARKLRRRRLCWEPIHLFIVEPPKDTDAEREWNIYLHKYPLTDAPALAKMLLSPTPLARSRRQEIVNSAIETLASNISSLLRSLDPTLIIEPDKVRHAIKKVMSELEDIAGEETLEKLRAELTRIERLPVISEKDLDDLAPPVSEAENQARESQHLSSLCAALHNLNNALSRARWRTEAAVDVGERIRNLLTVIQERGINALPRGVWADAGQICENLSALVKMVIEQRIPDDLPEQIKAIFIQLRDLRQYLDYDAKAVSYDAAIKRIIVVEDDPEWRKLIVSMLQSMLLKVEILEVDNVADARRLLLEERHAALALVDLGLPLEPDSEVVLDAGLSLIKQFSGAEANGRRFPPHRFVLLTAAENYSAAVCDAISFGVSPRSYLPKNPRTWESELQSQVHLAMKASSKRLPNIEVFERNSRIARIEGLKIKLDYPQWCLLAAFAESRKQIWCNEDAIARVLANEPYRLDPESHSNRTDNLSSEERIKLQLPHYIADLRAKLTGAYFQATHEPLLQEFISSDSDDDRKLYRLNANARMINRVDEHFRLGHKPSVLVVENDRDWGQQIVKELQQHGFEPRLARWTSEAWQMFDEKVPDILSLDLNLPATEEEWINGQSSPARALELLRRIRQECPNLPIAVLTAVQGSMILELFREGVQINDYLSKHGESPISRLIGSLSRLRQESITKSRISDWDTATPIYPIEIDAKTGLLTKVAGHQIKIPRGYCEIISKRLSATPNEYVSRTKLIDAVYPNPDDMPENPDNALNQHISRFRRIITESTPDAVTGEHVICGDRGVLWLRGIVQ